MNNNHKFFEKARASMMLVGLCFFAILPFSKIQAQSQCQLPACTCPASEHLLTGITDTSAGILICCTTSIPMNSGVQCWDGPGDTCSCTHAFTHRYYNISNVLKWCPTVGFYGITVRFKKDPNSTKWMICHPLKNFGSDCYTDQYSMGRVINFIPTALPVGTCLDFPPQDTTKPYEDEFYFTLPTRTLSHGTPPADCTSTTDLTWTFPPGDHFSFEIYGAAGSTAANDGDADGIDILLDFHDTFTNTFWRIGYDTVSCSANCLTIWPCTD